MAAVTTLLAMRTAQMGAGGETASVVLGREKEGSGSSTDNIIVLIRSPFALAALHEAARKAWSMVTPVLENATFGHRVETDSSLRLLLLDWAERVRNSLDSAAVGRQAAGLHQLWE
ncbi:hypothetical protein T492DRAFT_895584, partial [Pavlovales sp. CCMP2436]